MKKFSTKMVLITMVAAVAMGTLTGCDDNTDPNTPAIAGDSEYEQQYVKLENGKTIMCLWYDKDSKTGAMSCDFATSYSNR